MGKVYLLTYDSSVYGRNLGKTGMSHIVGVYGDPKSALADMRENVRKKIMALEEEEGYRFDGEADDKSSVTRWYLDDKGNLHSFGWCIRPFAVKGAMK